MGSRQSRLRWLLYQLFGCVLRLRRLLRQTLWQAQSLQRLLWLLEWRRLLRWVLWLCELWLLQRLLGWPRLPRGLLWL